MCRSRLGHPSPALIVSTIALIVAMGGTSYAAFSLPKNSVGTKQLKNGAVTGAKIKRGSVTRAKIAKGTITGAKIADGTITGTNINLGSLGTVPSAINATHATTADSAPFVTTLPPGQTLRGAWNLFYPPNAGLTQNGQSFIFALAAKPAQHVIPSSGPNPDPTDCPGTASNPQAASGQFCLYVTTLVNLSTPTVCDPTIDTCDVSPSRWGFFLQVFPVTASSTGRGEGTWAVTG
jgi:hypothetical protein